MWKKWNKVFDRCNKVRFTSFPISGFTITINRSSGQSCTLVVMPILKLKSWIDSVRVTRITKEFQIVYRLFLIIVIYCKETYKAKQKQKLANFFNTYLYLVHIIEQPNLRIPNPQYLQRNFCFDFFNDSENTFWGFFEI